MPQTSAMDFKNRINRALKAFVAQLDGSETHGHLCQVWTPESFEDGIFELCAQGRPFAVSGNADLLALFRYVSVSYKFTTDVSKPHAQGAVGRVYSSCVPELCRDVQSLDRTYYHRANEAFECNVNSMLVVPFWGEGSTRSTAPLGVCELITTDSDVDFENMLLLLGQQLQIESFQTCSAEDIGKTSSKGLGKFQLADSVAGSSEGHPGSLENRSLSHGSSGSVLLGLDSPIVCSALRQRYPMISEYPDDSSRSSSQRSTSSSDPRKAAELLAGRFRAHGKGSDMDKLIIGDSIGHGSFGSVHKGKWRNLDVAVKTILFFDHGEGSSGSQKRAVMEAAVSSSVVHPNVVCTYQYDITPVHSSNPRGQLTSLEIVDERKSGSTDWKLYLIQELCQSSLRDALVAGVLHDKASDYCPFLDAIILVLMDVARGMDYLHSKNIIHGDLKPENILLKPDMASPLGLSCKITDFGLSTSIDGTCTHVSNFSNGTPFYAAPEVVGSGQATTKSDVYSFGVLMWVLYCRMPPWIKAANISYEWNPAFGSFPPGCPQPYVALCFSCLQVSSKHRPMFSEVLSKLQALLKSLTTPVWASRRDTVAMEAPAPAPPQSHGDKNPEVQQQLMGAGFANQVDALRIPNGDGLSNQGIKHDTNLSIAAAAGGICAGAAPHTPSSARPMVAAFPGSGGVVGTTRGAGSLNAGPGEAAGGAPPTRSKSSPVVASVDQAAAGALGDPSDSEGLSSDDFGCFKSAASEYDESVTSGEGHDLFPPPGPSSNQLRKSSMPKSNTGLSGLGVHGVSEAPAAEAATAWSGNVESYSQSSELASKKHISHKSMSSPRLASPHHPSTRQSLPQLSSFRMLEIAEEFIPVERPMSSGGQQEELLSPVLSPHQLKRSSSLPRSSSHLSNSPPSGASFPARGAKRTPLKSRSHSLLANVASNIASLASGAATIAPQAFDGPKLASSFVDPPPAAQQRHGPLMRRKSSREASPLQSWARDETRQVNDTRAGFVYTAECVDRFRRSPVQRRPSRLSGGSCPVDMVDVESSAHSDGLFEPSTAHETETCAQLNKEVLAQLGPKNVSDSIQSYLSSHERN